MATTDEKQDSAAGVQGHCEERFALVRDVLATHLDNGVDLGASVAVTLDGEMVVDIWGGWADEDKTRPWEQDTITNVWSTTKTMAALCALMVADAGELDFDAPVSRYWPEFAAGGKGDRVLVRHVMSHTAGLAGWTEPMTVEDLYDWEKATSLLAAQEPWWEAGTVSGYHAVTQGYLVGEILRRITGQTIGTFFAERVAGPVGADFHIGLPESEDSRVSFVVPPGSIDEQAANASEMALRGLTNPRLDGTEPRTAGWRRAEIPAANGHGNARSVALIQAAVANGGEVAGTKLMSPAGCERIFEEQIRGTDLVLGVPMRLGIGYGLTSPETPVSPSKRACYWGGWGGSVIVVDLDAHMTFAYM
ncbi:MAG TPA: serine hydrolase domain-containing protein, partial [Acidimicrobiales bacterium]|nr:serine hydrolase domain-containing protein [Acidimicrobiales bacterium]